MSVRSRTQGFVRARPIAVARALTYLTVCLVFALYPYVRNLMLDQNPAYTARSSNITVNYILALYLFGLAGDRVAKKWGRKKGWIVWGIGLAVLLLSLKYVAGWQTRW